MLRFYLIFYFYTACSSTLHNTLWNKLKYKINFCWQDSHFEIDKCLYSCGYSQIEIDNSHLEIVKLLSNWYPILKVLILILIIISLIFKLKTYRRPLIEAFAWLSLYNKCSGSGVIGISWTTLQIDLHEDRLNLQRVQFVLITFYCDSSFVVEMKLLRNTRWSS